MNLQKTSPNSCPNAKSDELLHFINHVGRHHDVLMVRFLFSCCSSHFVRQQWRITYLLHINQSPRSAWQPRWLMYLASALGRVVSDTATTTTSRDHEHLRNVLLWKRVNERFYGDDVSDLDGWYHVPISSTTSWMHTWSSTTRQESDFVLHGEWNRLYKHLLFTTNQSKRAFVKRKRRQDVKVCTMILYLFLR